MSEQSKTEQSFPTTLLFSAPIFAEAWQMPMKVLLEEHAELLDEGRKMSAAWMKRQQEATEAGLQAFGALAGCRDPGTVAAICSEWFKGSMDRLMADMNDARDEGARFAEIGQRSAMALFRQRVDTVAADKLTPSAPNREPERAKRPSRSESGREMGERSAAE